MMSNILEKTIGTVLVGSNSDQFAGIKGIYEKCLAARTKQQETELIKVMMLRVKERLTNPSTRPLLAGHCLAFTVFAQLMGFNVDFAQIHAINLAQQTSMVEKKMGYVACCCLLTEKNELSLLLVNTLMRDLASSNVAVVGLAISALCSAPLPRDAIPSLLPALLDRLHHPKAYIRCRAVTAAHHLLRQHPEHCNLGSVVSLLGDEDPHVVQRVLTCLPDIIDKSPESVSSLVHSLVAIQRQILGGKLPPDLTYRNLPAPWMQLSIIKCLPELCLTEEEEYACREVLLETIKVCSLKNASVSDPPIRAAIISTALIALLGLEEPNEASKVRILQHVEALLKSENCDTKNEGLLLLESALVKYQFALTSEQQSVIKLSLEHEDISIRRRALGLLSAGATEKDVQSVCGQLFTQAVSTKDESLKQWLLEQALQLMDRFPNALTADWKLSALIKLMPLAEDIKIGQELMNRTKHILLTGDLREDTRLKMLSVLTGHSESKSAPTSLLKLYIWTLGNFPQLEPQGEAFSKLLALGNKLVTNAKTEKSTRELLLLTISSMRKVADEANFITLDGLEPFLKEASDFSALHMLEASEFCKSLPHLDKVTNCLKKETDLDFSLSALDTFVLESIEKENGKLYQPQVAIQILQPKIVGSPDLAHLLPVVLPQNPSPVMVTSQESINASEESGSAISQSLEGASQETATSKLWTKEGRVEAPRPKSTEPLVQALGLSKMQLQDIQPAASKEDPLGDLFT